MVGENLTVSHLLKWITECYRKKYNFPLYGTTGEVRALFVKSAAMSGYVGDLSSHQEKALKELKEMLTTEPTEDEVSL